MPTLIYHITHCRNLEGILACGYILRKIDAAERGYTNLAHADIQAARGRRVVTCGPGGNLHDYVPWYFAPRSPMLCAIHHGRVDGYKEGQAPVVHIVSSIEAVIAAGVPFIFSDGQARMEISSLYDDLAELKRIDWPLMRARYWSDTQEDPDRCRRRQAEFLIHDKAPVGIISQIVAMNQATKNFVVDAARRYGLQCGVSVDAGWYF